MPVSFTAGEYFHDRDSGLIAKTLRSMGIESKCILTLPWKEGSSHNNIIRTEYKNLESVDWWKSLGIDGLVFYSWGAPRYRKIAKAVHKAGIRLHIHLDTSGNFNGTDFDTLPPHRKLVKYLHAKVVDYFRAKHIKCADIITMGEPAAAQIRNRLFYGDWIIDKLVPMPCPVSSNFTYNGCTKQDIILCIGRWDDTYQKRPEVLMQCLEQFYRTGGSATTRIFGTITDDLKHWHASLEPQISEKIILVGVVDNSMLIQEYQQAKIVLCTSRFESSHIVSAEGLCCGCSIVTPNRPKELCDLHWYTSHQSGTIANQDTPEALAEALTEELANWEKGERIPHSIASYWQPYFHIKQVIHNIFK